MRDEAPLRRAIGCARFVWNEVLAFNELRHERGEQRLGYAAMCEYLLYLKNEYPFLREAPSQALQQTLKDLAAAYKRAFNPKLPNRMPRFKKRGRTQGIRIPQKFKINASTVYLPRIGWIGFRKSREIEGVPKNITLSHDGHDWFITVQTEREFAPSVHPSDSVVGIDLGVAHFAALSDGTFIEGANAEKKHGRRLAYFQRQMARKRKFSANWQKAKTRISRLQRKIANIRADVIHKASTRVSKNHAVVVLEDLRITNMTASARGSTDKPGTNVRAKSGLNRRILDQGWGEFRRQLAYKLSWGNGALVLVDPRNTSRACSACGHTCAENRRTQAAFHCVACGWTSNADTNAAINILRRAGLARIACGDSSTDGSTKQEARFTAGAMRRKILDL